MKKLILSATFALACFTAQAKNEVIKNDDDKNPKKKIKTEQTNFALCTACGYVSGWICGGVATTIGTCRTRATCGEVAAALEAALNSANCN